MNNIEEDDYLKKWIWNDTLTKFNVTIKFYKQKLYDYLPSSRYQETKKPPSSYIDGDKLSVAS